MLHNYRSRIYCIWLIRLMRQVFVIGCLDKLLWQVICAGLVHGWCICLWYRLRYRLMYGTCWHRLLVQVVKGWLQVDWYRVTTVYLIVIVWQWFHHSTYISGKLDGARKSCCTHVPVVVGEHRGLYPPYGCSQRIGELELPSSCSLGN